jgi:hypothetical protein
MRVCAAFCEMEILFVLNVSSPVVLVASDILGLFFLWNLCWCTRGAFGIVDINLCVYNFQLQSYVAI